MAANVTIDLAREYAAWLKERITAFQHGEDQVLSTPFLDPFHDGIQVYSERQNGEIVLHDAGHTLDNLSSLGVNIEDSERRAGLIQRAIAGCGVDFRMAA